MNEDKRETVAKCIFRATGDEECIWHAPNCMWDRGWSQKINLFLFLDLVLVLTKYDNPIDMHDRRLCECILPGPNNARGLACLWGQVYRGFGKQPAANTAFGHVPFFGPKKKA